MGRSTNIHGRVMRNIGSVNISSRVYDEMNEAQKTIVSRVITEQSFSITMVKGQTDYPLVSVNDAIRNIKDFIQPDEWETPIVLVDSSEWNDIIHSTIISTQPLYATTFDNILKLFPMESIVGGEVLETWCYLQAPLTTITKDVEPELPNIWDKAIEYFATAQLISPEKAVFYLNQFEASVDNLALNGFISNKKETIEANW